MAIAVTFTQGTMNILRQTNMPPGRYGQPQGTWWWMGAISGDASGGNTLFQFTIAERFKNQWAFSLQCATIRANANFGAPAVRFSWNSGPEKEISGALFNPTYQEIGTFVSSAGLVAAGFAPPMSFDERLIALGDPQIAGAFGMSEWEIAANINGATTIVTMWGLLYDWSTFYRGAPATKL